MLGTDKVEGSLMVLFFSLVFSVAPPSGKFFCRRPWEGITTGTSGIATKGSYPPPPLL